MSRTVKPPSGGFRPQNSLNQPISGSAISGVQQASFTTQRFAPPAEEIEDVDDDIVETFNNVSSSGSTRPRRPGLISKKRPFPGDVEDVNRQDKRPTKPHRRNSSIEISSDSENPKAVDSAIKQGGKGQAAAEKMPANPQQHRERQEPQRPSEAPPLDRPAKKRRASNSSGDELVESTSSKAGRHTHDSVSSLNGHGPRTAKSAEPKGVIRKTTFKKQASKLSLAISRAVSSKWSLAATKLDSGDQPRLELVNPNRLRPVTARGPLQGYHWLEVKINTCHSIKYSSDGGLGVWIKRSAGDSIPGELALEFATSDDHNKFVSWCRERSRSGGLTKLIEEETSWFEKLFQKKLSEQKATAVHQAHKSEADDIRYLEHQERAMLARSAEKEQSKPPSESVEEERPTARRSLREGMKDEPPGPSSSTRASTLSPSGPNALRPLEPPRTRRALKNPTPPVAPVRERWIDKHPEWTEIWDKQPLIYPAKGRNPAQVAKDDMLRLEEGELLNDNLIVFYLRYLQTKLEKENKGLADRIYFMNPWFYQKLTHGKGRNINYDAVKSWTAKVDLLSHDYIVVPINEHMHWYLAIICHPSKLVPSEEAQEAPTKDAMQESKKQPEGDPAQLGGSASGEEAQAIDEDDVQIVSDLPFGPKSNHTSTSRMTSPKVQPGRKAKGMRQADPTEPRVITLDSLGGPHSRTCTNLRDYLVQEIKHRRNIDVEPPSPFGMTAKGIPEQDDFSSCGVYLLAYMERFLEDPDQVVRDITGKVDLRWNINTSKLRGEIRELIIKLRHEQNARIRAEKKTRLQAKAQNASSQKTRVGDAPTTAPKISGTSDPSARTKGGKDSPSDCLSSGSPPGSRSPARIPAAEDQAGDTREYTATEVIESVRSPVGENKASPRNSTERPFLSPMRDSSEGQEDKEPKSSADLTDDTQGSKSRGSSTTIEGSAPIQEASKGEAQGRLTPLHPGGRASEEDVRSTPVERTPPGKPAPIIDAIFIADSPESTAAKPIRNPIIRSPYFPHKAAAKNVSSSSQARDDHEERWRNDDRPAIEVGNDATANSHDYGGTGDRPAGVRVEPIVLED